MVPLGVRASARFYAINNGFTALELVHKLPSYVPVLVELAFPEGKSKLEVKKRECWT